jgi:hypothetical protein
VWWPRIISNAKIVWTFHKKVKIYLKIAFNFRLKIDVTSFLKWINKKQKTPLITVLFFCFNALIFYFMTFCLNKHGLLDAINKYPFDVLLANVFCCQHFSRKVVFCHINLPVHPAEHKINLSCRKFHTFDWTSIIDYYWICELKVENQSMYEFTKIYIM